jgi:23S rRNA (cytosine1962-C5)-methyltransferase
MPRLAGSETKHRMRIILAREAAPKIRQLKHPWIFRNAIRSIDGEPENGAVTAVCGDDGVRLGTGFYSTESKIACRVFSWGPDAPADDWIVRRLESALALRRALHIETNAYRLLNAEGDFFPGLVIDVYGDTIVLRPSVRAAERLTPELLAALAVLFPGRAVYLKRDEKAARVEKLELATGYLSGQGDDTAVPMEENGVRYLVDIREGQKTGFYLDQRDNRQMVAGTARGKSVLNLFSYTGAFALAALQGGARQVDSVDISRKALDGAEKNYALNSFPQPHEARWIKEDGFDFLDHASNYDIIILDPPPFARTKGEVPGAIRGYRRLQSEALKRLRPQGFLAAFSCSGAVDQETFRRVFFEAALEAGRPVQVMQELRAAGDHPWDIRHREGEYLKGIWAHVE